MKLFLALFSTVICLLVSASSAYAYLDPGTGSMIIQALLGTIAAVSVSAALFWRRLVYFFKNLFDKSPKN